MCYICANKISMGLYHGKNCAHVSGFRDLVTAAIFPLSQHVIRFHELPADTTQRFYNRAVRIMHRYCIMQHGFYVSNTIY